MMGSGTAGQVYEMAHSAMPGLVGLAVVVVDNDNAKALAPFALSCDTR
jgi:hypothetical protein